MWKRFITDNRATTAIEYALIASLIALLVIGGATSIGNKTNTQLQSISSEF